MMSKSKQKTTGGPKTRHNGIISSNNTPQIYTGAQVDALYTRWKTEALQHFDSLEAHRQLEMLALKIDAIALSRYTKQERIDKLSGLDGKLTEAYQQFVKFARYAGIDVLTQFPETQHSIAGRVEGLVRYPTDNGEYLLNVISDRPGEIGLAAFDIRDKVAPGERLNEASLRFYEMVEDCKRDGLTGWAAFSNTILTRLRDIANDDIDRELMADLELQDRNDNLETYSRQRYHNFKHSKAGSRYLSNRK